MQRIIQIAAFAILSTLAFISYAKSTASNQMKYQNQRGSILIIEQHVINDKTGTITGTFTSAVGNCEQDVNVEQPISGYYNENVISLVTNFSHCGVSAAMSGHMTDNGQHLSLLWIATSQSSDPSGKGYDSNMIGQDEYQAISKH